MKTARCLAGPVALLLGLLALAAPATGQLHKDTRLGFQIKAPRKFDPVALSPTERLTVAKWQSPQKEVGQELGTYFNSTFEVQFYPASMLEEGDTREELHEQLWDRVESASGYAEILKDKTTKIAGSQSTYKHIRGERSGLTHFVALVDQEDGVFLVMGAAISERFGKYDNDFLKAARSLKRIDKEDRSIEEAERSQMSDQERFLQAQIDKLPEGWEHLRTDRYLFLFNAERTWVKELAERIEAIRDLYEELYPPDEPITAVSIVRVCASFDQYLAYGGREGTGGYWSSAARELVIFDRPPRATTEAIINHEAFHQYIYYFYGELAPHSWYNEGTGDYFAGADMTRTYRVKSFGDAPGGIGRKATVKEACRLLAAGRTEDRMCATPLKDLMRYTQREYYANGGVHYAQGWALIHMLRESKRLDPKWDRILDDYLVFLLEARREVASEVMEREREQAEKRKKGSADELSDDPADYFSKADTDDIQRLAYEKTFADWTDDDWEEFNAFYLDYVEDL